MPTLADLTRTPLLLGASLLGFLSIARAPARLDDEIYRSGSLEARVHSPRHVREHEPAPIEIAIRNVSERRRDLVVSLSPEWAESLATLDVLPPIDDAWSVRLPDVGPGEERVIALELEAGAPGAIDGEIRVHAAGADALAIPIHEVVEP